MRTAVGQRRENVGIGVQTSFGTATYQLREDVLKVEGRLLVGGGGRGPSA